VAGAFFLIIWIVASLDNALNITQHFLLDDRGHPMYIPGIGILTVLLILIFVGFVFTTLVTEPIKNWFSRTINRIPLFSTLYSSIKDFTEAFRSEEHTSELQSRENLVCRLLLEKK